MQLTKLVTLGDTKRGANPSVGSKGASVLYKARTGAVKHSMTQPNPFTRPTPLKCQLTDTDLRICQAPPSVSRAPITDQPHQSALKCSGIPTLVLAMSILATAADEVSCTKSVRKAANTTPNVRALSRTHDTPSVASYACHSAPPDLKLRQIDPQGSKDVSLMEGFAQFGTGAEFRVEPQIFTKPPLSWQRFLV